MDKNRRITLAALVAGLVMVLAVSCGDDGGTNLPCENCDFWSKAFGGAGRFPSASPVDPELLAFSSMRDTSGTSSKHHIWVVERAAEGDTTWSYQITFDDNHDFNPVWSPDGQKIAFERNIGAGDEWHIFVVDVSDLESPGPVEAITETDSTVIPYSNRSPSWVTLAGETWISFCNTPLGSGDSDIGLIRYPGLGDPVWISIDPKDFADNENGVMSYVFDDQLASSNGTNLITFSSPNRQEVIDIKVLATSEEQQDSSVVARILINEKDSGRYTPYTFRYRPVTMEVEIKGALEETYCATHPGVLIEQSDTLHTYLVDFVHTHGTIGVRSNPGDRFVYFNDEPEPRFNRTPMDPELYVFFRCILPDTYVIWTESIYHVFCGVDSSVIVAPGETTLVSFDCGLGAEVREAGRPSLGGSRVTRTVTADPRPLQQNSGSVWLVDLGDEPGIADDEVYFVDGANEGLFYPALSPDGKYVAYARGEDTSWDVVVRDVSELQAGGEVGRRIVIGLPGSTEDVECWRKLEKISWLPMEAGRKVVASISVCRGVETEIWIADLSRFLD